MHKNGIIVYVFHRFKHIKWLRDKIEQFNLGSKTQIQLDYPETESNYLIDRKDYNKPNFSTIYENNIKIFFDNTSNKFKTVGLWFAEFLTDGPEKNIEIKNVSSDRIIVNVEEDIEEDIEEDFLLTSIQKRLDK